MPNITLFIAAEKMPSDEVRSLLTEQCTVLCTEVLHAALENVHIVYVGVHHGRGHPVFADIKYRLDSFRTKAVMDVFMDKLDVAIQQATGLTARIRCFAYAATVIYARN
jgi:hypothetical protein